MSASGRMFSVISCNAAPHHLKQLRHGTLHSGVKWTHFLVRNDGYSMPSPLLVVDGKELLGGLAFTSYSIRGGKELGLWIYGLVVITELRGNGLGSQLV